MKSKGGVSIYPERSRRTLSLSLSRKPIVFVVLALLIFGVFFSISSIIPPAKKAEAAVVSSDTDLLNWRFDPYALTPHAREFGNTWYDPDAGIYRMIYDDSAVNTRIRMMTGSNPRQFFNETLALDLGLAGAWDDSNIGVPFIWYEAGQTRPWRMIYRGAGTASLSVSWIGLATALSADVNGNITWERKDTNGNALTDAIIKDGAVAEWDDGSIDFGSAIKVGNTYYLYYNTINLTSRRTGLATSTDLVNWTKYTGNPLFNGVVNVDSPTQGPDKNYDGTPDANQGFFCGDIVYWPRTDGSARYVLITPHYSGVHTLVSFDLFVSDSPIFTKANRTYIGKVFQTSTLDKYISGLPIQSGGSDTPRITTDDITRNVATSVRTGNDIIMVGSVYASGASWLQTAFIWNKTLHGAILSNVDANNPSSNNPVYSLSPSFDADTVAIWLPSVTENVRDLAGNNYHLSGASSVIDYNGVKFDVAKNQFLTYGGTSAQIAALNNITGDFTVEMRTSFASNFTSSFRIPWSFEGGAGNHHLYTYVTGAAGPTYTLNFSVSSGGLTKSASVPLGAITLDQMYRITISRTGGKIYFFKDGVLLNAGGTAFGWVIDSTPNAPLYMGGLGGSYNWDGYIDEIRVSDTARWTANYTPAALAYNYQPSGTIFTKVYDFGVGNNQTAAPNPTMVVPPNTTVTQYIRSATSASDQSSNIADFSPLPQSNIKSQFMQFALVLATTDTTQTPTISEIDVTATPTITVQDATLITTTTATLNGNITDTGGENATERGFNLYNGAVCAGGSIQNPKDTGGSYGTGAFSKGATTLTANTAYSYIAYAINTGGTGTGACQPLTTLSVPATPTPTPTPSPTESPTPTPTPTPSESSTATPEESATGDETISSWRQWLPWSAGTTTSPSDSFTTIPTDLSAIEVGQEIIFDASSLGGDIIKYEWDFSDGVTSSGVRVSHKYEKPGRYTVTLTTTDKSGNKSTYTKIIDIRPPAPTISDIKADGTSIVFEGKSYPETTVDLTIHSDPYSGQAVADKDGKFTYTVEQGSETLGEGDHTVLASAAVILSDNTQLKSKDSKTYDFKVSVDDGKLKVEMGKTKIWKIISIVLGGIIVIGLAAIILRRRKGFSRMTAN